MINVLILAGGSVRDKLTFLKSSCECPALIPINTKPAISYICDFYAGYPDLKLNLAVNLKQKEIIESEVSSYDYDINIIAMPDTGNVNESLEYSLENIPGEGSVIVNLVTTIPTYLPLINEVLIDRKKSISVGWAGINLDIGDPVLISKNDGTACMESHAFTGIFHVKLSAFKDAINTKSNDMLDVISGISKNVNLIYRKTDWIDCGHELNYYEAKSKLMNSRKFNLISIQDNSLVTKRSLNKKKLQQEYQFIRMLPPQLAHYFPRIIKDYYEDDDQYGSYSIEFYGYPNLAELCLYWDIDEKNWFRIFSYLEKHLRIFRQFSHSIGMKAHRAFYTDKFLQRLEEYTNQIKKSGNASWLSNAVKINGQVCEPLDQIRGKIIKKFDQLYDEDHFCVSHGDFCFSNILYDLSSGIIKYIDPRGSFSERCAGIYGDQKYDLAKLAHSTIGNYDYIVNNLYEYEENDQEIIFRFKLRKNHALLEELTKKIIEEMGYEFEDIYFIMATLFISMTPLHTDSSRKQKILYLHGLNILNSILIKHEKNMH